MEGVKISQDGRDMYARISAWSGDFSLLYKNLQRNDSSLAKVDLYDRDWGFEAVVGDGWIVKASIKFGFQFIRYLLTLSQV